MNKAVDALIPNAYKVLNDVGIAKNGVINKTWRGQISTFGSVIKNGSLLAAVAFFSAQGGSNVKRERLMMAIWLLLNYDKRLDVTKPESCRVLFDFVQQYRGSQRKLKEDIINRAIALKLAMNLYELKKESKDEVIGEVSDN